MSYKVTFPRITSCSLVIITAFTSQASPLTRTKPLSAAMKRHKVDDSENEFTRFRYEPVKGLGYERGVHRRDPSTIVKVDDLYYVWYTHCADARYKWLNADIWYATSPDGINWAERGPAVKRGPKGSWDDFSVFTTNILVAGGKYYLCYQARTFASRRNVVGMARADSPDGPWMKLPEPILRATPDGKLKQVKGGYANWSHRSKTYLRPEGRTSRTNSTTQRVARAVPGDFAITA